MIPSRWIDEHEAVLYKQREPLSILAASIWPHNYSTALFNRHREKTAIIRESTLGESYLTFKSNKY